MAEQKRNWEVEKDAAAQIELEHLEREFRAMRRDREACPEDVRAVLGKQKTLIKFLEKEKTQLLTRLADIKSRASMSDKAETVGKVRELVAERASLADEIEQKRIILSDIKGQIKIVKDKIDVILKESKGTNLDDTLKEEKADENLETRLHVESIKFNELTRVNAKLRGDVEDLLHDRSRFLMHFKTLSTELGTGKKIICDLIEQSNIAFNQRKEAEFRLLALKSKARQDLLTNCAEMQKIERKIEQGIMLNDFISKKSQKRISEAVEREKVVKQERAIKDMEDFLKNYSKVVSDIKEKFGEEDLDHLVMQFMKLEEDNYNIYSFINELNKKLDAMRDEVKDLQGAIETRRELNKTNNDAFCKELTVLERKLESKRDEVVDASERLESTKQNVDTLLFGIHDLFKIINVDLTPILQLLGNNANVTPENVFKYLQLLEGRLKEIAVIALLNISKSAQRKSRIARSVTSFSKRKLNPVTLLPGQPCPLCAEARDISEVDESLAVPLEFDDARENLKQVLRRGSRADIVHSVAECRLPQSRRIIQRRQN